MQTVVVNRHDFVGNYIGQTVLKTEKLLRANLDKTLLIEESHALCVNDRDTFGREAVDTIKSFMSKNPNSKVIFG